MLKLSILLKCSIIQRIRVPLDFSLISYPTEAHWCCPMRCDDIYLLIYKNAPFPWSQAMHIKEKHPRPKMQSIFVRVDPNDDGRERSCCSIVPRGNHGRYQLEQLVFVDIDARVEK